MLVLVECEYLFVIVAKQSLYLFGRAVAACKSDYFRRVPISGAEMQKVGVFRHNRKLVFSCLLPNIKVIDI